MFDSPDSLNVRCLPSWFVVGFGLLKQIKIPLSKVYKQYKDKIQCFGNIIMIFNSNRPLDIDHQRRHAFLLQMCAGADIDLRWKQCTKKKLEFCTQE